MQQNDEPTAGSLFQHDPPTSTKERLIQAAIERYYEYGIHAVGLDAICADVGISKQAFYRHFESKDALTHAAIAKRDDTELTAFAKMVEARASTPKEKLLAVFEVLDHWFNHPDYAGCLFLTACHEFPNPRDPTHAAAANHYRRSEQWLTSVAREAGVTDPQTLALQLIVLMEGALTHRLVSGDDGAARISIGIAKTLLSAHAAR